MTIKSWLTGCTHWLQRGKQDIRGGHRVRQPQRTRLTCEALETRIAPALGNPLATFLNPNSTDTGRFGFSVAGSGSNVLVGDFTVNAEAGAAYLYNMSGQLLQTFQDPNGTANDDFGFTVALSGSNVLVGADGANGNKGTAYLYNTSGQLLQTFQDPNNTAGDGFGTAVAIAGGNVLVGALGVNEDAGAAYLYDTSGQLLQTFQDPNNAVNDEFGGEVAIAGSNVLVGAIGANENKGAAYLFDTSGQLLQSFLDPNNEALELFGDTVAVSDSNVLLSARLANEGAGVAFLYDTSGQLLRTFQDPTGTPQDDFGSGVALSGSNVLVGADGANGNKGTAYLYNTSGQLLQTFQDPNNTRLDNFGNAVALSGSNVLVAADASANQGAAYLYQTASDLSAAAGNNQSTPAGAAFGTALEVQVSDSFGNPISGASVTFTENSGTSGAGATFTGSTTVVSNAQGLAVAPVLTASDTIGNFTVTASMGNGLSTQFNLTSIRSPAVELAFANVPTAVTAGQDFTTTVNAADAQGNTDVSYNGSVDVLVSSAPTGGKLTGGTAFIPFANGMATFNSLSLTLPGTYTLIAVSNGDLLAASTTITVVPPAAQLRVTADMTSPAAGTPVTVTVKGLTSAGSPDTLFSDALTLTTSDGKAQVVAGQIAAGVETFTVTFETSGKQTITVTDLTQPGIKGTKATVYVVAGAVSQLHVGGLPLYAIAGKAYTFSVTAEDQYGNRVSDFTDAINVAGQSYSFKPRDNGSHVFTTTFTAGSPDSVTATDSTDSTVQVGTQSITVVNADVAAIADPSNSADSALVIIAPPSGGTVVIKPGNAAGTAIVITINGKMKALPTLSDPLGLIVVYGQFGNDTIEEKAARIGGTKVLVSIPAVLLGGSGNDILSTAGSNADNILVGGAGKNTLTGGNGNDILIGGGPASLHAGTGDDILVAGSTIDDANVAALVTLMSTWSAQTSFEQRVKELFGGPLALTDVMPAPAGSQLFGGSGTGQDWFWLKPGDVLSDYAAGDVVTLE